jgi:hypothetical protein
MKWHWNRFLSEFFGFTVDIPPLFFTFTHASSGRMAMGPVASQFHT